MALQVSRPDTMAAASSEGGGNFAHRKDFKNLSITGGQNRFHMLELLHKRLGQNRYF
jgi:hypothetical protein